MQLTNYGFIESRGNYISARSNYERPMERLSTGLKINHSRDDVGAISLVGKNGYCGEIKCITNERMSAVAAEMRRVDMKIAELEDQHI